MILKKLNTIKYRWKVKKAQKAVDSRLREKLEIWVKDEKYALASSMDQVADELDVSVEQLRHYFAHHMSLRFYAWRKKLRIDKACAMMADYPEMSTTMIARQCGFNDKSTFRRQFIEITGITPKEWRDKISV